MKIYELQTGNGEEYDPTQSHGFFVRHELAEAKIVSMALAGNGLRAAEIVEHEVEGAEIVEHLDPEPPKAVAFVADAEALAVDPWPWQREAGGEILSDAEGGFVVDCTHHNRAAFILRAVRFYVEQHGLGR